MQKWLHNDKRLHRFCIKSCRRNKNLESRHQKHTIEGLRERTDHLDNFFFPPVTQWCSISNVLFSGRRGVSDFSVLKYY